MRRKSKLPTLKELKAKSDKKRRKRALRANKIDQGRIRAGWAG